MHCLSIKARMSYSCERSLFLGFNVLMSIIGFSSAFSFYHPTLMIVTFDFKCLQKLNFLVSFVTDFSYRTDHGYF